MLGIAEQLCIECGSSELYSNKEIKVPMMCVDCYGAMIGFARVGSGFVDIEELVKEQSQ
ncbi:hypothetical protein [Acinetobacter junii]|uniref:hypothetical protein n=1 Tax=Acinetobacter junii TaxID=40215 RepID=UPI00148F40FA|nr:hypothetical protein [Acinetobacter junii]